MTANYDHQRLQDIRLAFHRMKKEEVKAFLRGEEYVYQRPLAALQAALISRDQEELHVALMAWQKLLTPLRIVTPGNYTRTQVKLARIEGFVEPNSMIALEVNQEYRLKTRADKHGHFTFKEADLTFGDNTLVCYNQDFLFVDNFRFFLHIHLERHYYFMGRHDPFTQRAFQADDLHSIVRCKTCHNFMYDYSVTENHGYCTMADCSSKAFFKDRDTEFWLP